MDSILTFDLIPYRLVLQREPFTLIIERGAQRLLQTTPHAEPITDSHLHEQEVHVTFPDSTLSITIADMAIHLYWQSAHRQRLAFTNYGYWYGQGGSIHLSSGEPPHQFGKLPHDVVTEIMGPHVAEPCGAGQRARCGFRQDVWR